LPRLRGGVRGSSPGAVANACRNARAAAQKQRIADESLTAERNASATVAAVLDRLGVASIEDLAHRRERLAELLRMRASADRANERAAELRAEETAHGSDLRRCSGGPDSRRARNTAPNATRSQRARAAAA